MKQLSYLFFSLFIALSSFGQFNMPSFKEVVTSFYSKYSFENYESYLKFQRKKSGWYVSEDKYNNPGNYFNTKLFWSKDRETYKELDYPQAIGDTDLVSENVSKYLTLINWDFEEYSFRRNQFYGYPGWDWDVINEDTSKNNLSDTLLESKARAYSNYATGFIAEQFGDLFVNNDSDRIPLKANEEISKSRIDKFIHYELKGINAYAEILRINPDFVTRVGNISIKLANEYLFSYLELLMAGDTANALNFMNKAAYPDSLLSLCKSYLSELPLSGILITAGDNDTYPLWYLQKVKNFRPDILVLNSSLIGFRRYLSTIRQQNKQPVFSTHDSSYLKDNFEYFLFGNKIDENTQIDVSTFLKNIEKNYNPYDNSAISYKDGTIIKYYSKQLYFQIDSKKKGIIFKIGDYLFLNDYILLDIINTAGKRKVFFTYEMELLSNLLTQKGNVFELKIY